MTSKIASEPTMRGPIAPRYRDDIDGLRAVAVLLVVVYHVWLGRVSGGVDAFLMISAFLLTGSLMRRIETTGRVGVATQWVRNFKRMLPAASIVIVATVAIGMAVLPASTHESLWRHAYGSALYFENWLLATEAADYYADRSLASPLQHFWSLSVQGQVFLLWPVLFVLIVFLSRALRGRIRPRSVALGIFGAVFVASLSYSIVATATDQSFAYFNTGARLWEFAAGSILALLIDRLTLPVVQRAVLGWLGIAALVACGLVLDVEGGFPGYLALWPVLSVAAVIISGNAEDRRYGPAMLLESSPVLAIGKSSYALYLVHWPALVFILVARRGEPLNLVEGLILILASIGVARLLTAIVDAPLRRSAWIDRSTWRGFGVILLSFALVAGVVVPIQAESERRAAAELKAIAEAEARQLTYRNPGAAVLFDGWNDHIATDAPVRPLPSEVPDQWGTLEHDCGDGSLMKLPRSVEICFVNDVDVDEATRTIVVVGDSHAQQMLAPIGAIAEQKNWRVISFLRGACAFGLRKVAPSFGGYYSQECRDWNEDVLDVIQEIEPDAVVTIGTRTRAANAASDRTAGQREAVPEGIETSVARLEAMDIPTILIRDNPRFTYNAYQCIEQSSDVEAECSIAKSQALARDNPLRELESSSTAIIDVSKYYCPDARCPAVIGNVGVYIDENHVSTLYLKTLQPVIDSKLSAALNEIRAH
ncbi:acyltransferase family protein [Leucobacter sp. NPDC058333]|uniref:acyltransferase family protein n=1 Tax=Leucobacter sp. NPDC058333 TaxID=3346450 RepID=UPI0036576F8A